ncbi:MAG: nucleoside monophosphate kinase [Candidatus Niyogibacteria bacterium]|nr:nucleoside monophosphate kinase [Candidatus Niyogibacteria bacterium]
MTQPKMVCWISLSGGGKDTQANLLRAALEARYGEGSVLWISLGDLFRAMAEKKKKTYAERLIKEKVLDVGDFAPSFVAIWKWANEIMQNLKAGQHVIFPSSPRTLSEARDLDDLANFFNLQACPIYLEVDRERAFQRLMDRGRADDMPETIRNRFAAFDKNVLPALEYYRTQSKSRLITIDANPTDQQKIHRDILKALDLV